jgi:hypothetical protein
MTALWIMMAFSIGTASGFALFALLQMSRETSRDRSRDRAGSDPARMLS